MDEKIIPIYKLPATIMQSTIIINKLIFWPSICCLALALWTITFGQSVPYEFRDAGLRSEIYHLIWSWTPLIILLTLFGTIKKRNTKQKNILVVLSTFGIVILFYSYEISNLFMGVGDWHTYKVAYENRVSPERQIIEQWMDMGVLGSSSRVVEVQPITKIFWEVTRIDTMSIDNTQWKRVDIDLVTN